MWSKVKKKELNTLVDEHSMAPAEIEKARKAINYVVKEVKKAMVGMQGIAYDHVFKGGAWKKGTLLREDCEADVVVFITSKGYQNFLVDMENTLIHIGNHITEVPNVHMLRESPFAITLRYKMVKINITVGYNIAKNSSENSIKEQRDGCLKLVQELSIDTATAISLSASFSESACSLVQWRNAESDQVLARAIKLVKYWNKFCFEQDASHKAQLPGYALEVLLANLYDKHKSRVNAPLLFNYALEIFANLETVPTDVILPDFRSISAPSSTRPLRIFDPCLGTDLIEDFESWRSLISIAKNTQKLLQEDASLEKVFFLQKGIKARKPTGQSPDVNEESTQQMDKITNDLTSLSSTLTEHKFITNIFYQALLDSTKFPKTEFTCHRHGGIIARVQVIGDLVIVEGGDDHTTCDLWATPAGIGNWNTTLEGAKPQFPVKLDFKIGGEPKVDMQGVEKGGDECVCLSVQEEGIKVQKSNPAKSGKWIAFYSKTKPGLSGVF